jgi:hypothetical protein
MKEDTTNVDTMTVAMIKTGRARTITGEIDKKQEGYHGVQTD